MPPKGVAFFVVTLSGKTKKSDGFARGNLLPTLSEGSLLRVSEIPVKKFNIGCLIVTTMPPKGVAFFVATLSGKTRNPTGSRKRSELIRIL